MKKTRLKEIIKEEIQKILSEVPLYNVTDKEGFNKAYEKFKDSSLNAYSHFYDWEDTGNNIFHQNQRRFWISN